MSILTKLPGNPFASDGDDVLHYLREKTRSLRQMDESIAIAQLLPEAEFSVLAQKRIAHRAQHLIEQIRSSRAQHIGIDHFLHEYDLSSQEGIVLMCVAEALLRIPDRATADLLIRDKIMAGQWTQHVARSDHLFLNASTWALMLGSKITTLRQEYQDHHQTLKHLIVRASEPLIRQAITAAIRLLGQHFIMGRTIDEALLQAKTNQQHGYLHSFDMLGEAARSQTDALRYLAAYRNAINTLATTHSHSEDSDIRQAPSISIKLSALHPRYEFSQKHRVMRELLPNLRDLALQAKRAQIGLTIDAEESDRLDLSLELIEALALEPQLVHWQGLGLAVQAYQKCAPAVLEYLSELARRSNRRFMLRLVKGAYWDGEIKLAQERGLETYPVYTNKTATDIAYLACARKLLSQPQVFYPQFATHNAQTVASILEMSTETSKDFEFQRLYGMGSELYDQLLANTIETPRCRIYAPVGGYADLLAYLVRRLLENGANNAFVHQLADPKTPIDTLTNDPVTRWCAHENLMDPASTRSFNRTLPSPRALFGSERINSRGLDLCDTTVLQQLEEALIASRNTLFSAFPTTTSAHDPSLHWLNGYAPANHKECLGHVAMATAHHIEQAFAQAQTAFLAWDATPAKMRAAHLERAADLFEQRCMPLMALIVREAGRTLPDALAEVRETIDFCRYYAARARANFGESQPLPGPTGEYNELTWHGRGVFVCISPWNFPLAIFIGQISAALLAGNSVLAKPAEQTPFIAAQAIAILHEAGIPQNVLHLLPGDGTVGAALVNDERTAGVAFTGSNATAMQIARRLVLREARPHTPLSYLPIVPLIAETGGQNVMIADSSALPEQLVRDVLSSAFNSAGQRCSALRVLYVQNTIADKVIPLLQGAMQELSIGDPSQLSSDIGPLIDEAACQTLKNHLHELANHAQLIHRCRLPENCEGGSFFAPQVWEIERIQNIKGEVFGPILHLIRWSANELDQILKEINDTAYGLTLGIHSRIDSTIHHITQRLRVGNIYVNRNMIGAVVGVQPFGGERLSGTGPKAGGPHYLFRFASERCLTINTAAMGGNAALLTKENAV